MMTYLDVQPRVVEIKTAVLSRRMPPWGAIKGFGDFRNDQALTQEQIELIVDWIQNDAPRGNNRRALPGGADVCRRAARGVARALVRPVSGKHDARSAAGPRRADARTRSPHSVHHANHGISAQWRGASRWSGCIEYDDRLSAPVSVPEADRGCRPGPSFRASPLMPSSI